MSVTAKQPPNGRALRCSELASQAERAGEWREAEEHYRECFRLSVQERNLPLLLDALRGIARALKERHLYEEGEEAAVLSWDIAERNTLPQAAARAINLLAVLRYAQANLFSARELWVLALERARDAGDDILIALVSQNLGVINHIAGDLGEARVLYLEGIGAAVRAQQLDRAMAVYNNLGKVSCDLGEWQEAELYFTRGLEIAERLSDRPMLARLMTNRVEALIQMAEIPLATRTLNDAEPMADEMEDAELQTMSARFRGELARRDGRYADAERHFQDGMALSVKSELDLERGHVLRAMAELRRQQGRTAAARAALREARHLYEKAGAKRSVQQIDALLILWPTSSGGPAGDPPIA